MAPANTYSDARFAAMISLPPMLSIVIPTLNAAGDLERSLPVVFSTDALSLEVIVADGGSSDGTAQVALKHGARLIETAPGRGSQLAAGARAATGEWLLFLHADTLLARGWAEAAAAFAANDGNRRRAAVFRFALDDDGQPARRMERLVAWRTRVLGLPYGDQGLLIGSDFYTDLGAFKSLPLMEDVDMIRRIGRTRLALLDFAAVTSAERFQRGGYILRPLWNLLCLGLYFLGIPAKWTARVYD